MTIDHRRIFYGKIGRACEIIRHVEAENWTLHQSTWVMSSLTK